MNLLLTLGHNSSAILTHNSHIFCGYEEERINRSKSSSDFPIHAVQECIRAAENDGDVDLEGGHLYISHWYDDFNFHSTGFSSHQWDPKIAKDLCQKYRLKLVSLQPSFTHHDAHAHAAVAFWRAHAVVEFGPVHVCVADGFGNKEEVFSVYVCDPTRGQIELKTRVYGYNNSLGLLYQYATSFCGMKENQDEYKFLGYESHVHETLTDSQIERLQSEAAALAAQYLTQGKNSPASLNNSYIDIPKLSAVKQRLYALFGDLVHKVTGRPATDFSPIELRRIIGHFVQCVIENFYTHIISDLEIENIIVTGGLHYNVKLNNHIMSKVPGDFCATPLAGDQGAAVGLMACNEGSVVGLDSLLWGHRDLKVPGVLNGQEFKPYHHYFSNRNDYVDFVTRQLRSNRIVNTITGSMEFGPRALCNTSTLALPTEENVKTINSLNGRDTVMPMAPVILDEMAHHFFTMDDRVVGSLEYMIVTQDYHPTLDISRFRGIMHPYPRVGARRGYSGRPQLVGERVDQPIRQILKNIQDEHPALINTSLNVHGVPIVYTTHHAVSDMNYNLSVAEEQCLPQPILVVGDF
jgi:predicted NodU family carbamoyl transferase